MASFIVLKTVSTVYEIVIEAKNSKEALRKALTNDFDNADIISETDGEVNSVEISKEVSTNGK